VRGTWLLPVAGKPPTRPLWRGGNRAPRTAHSLRNRARRTAHVVPLASRGAVARFEGLLTGGADSKFRSRAGL